MGLGNVRLLIVVENADYRAALSNIFMPEAMHEQLSGRLSPADIHIVTAAARWSPDVQAVAIFSCYSEATYSDRTYLKVGLMGSGIPLPDEPAAETVDKSGGAPAPSAAASRKLVRLVAEFCPTHLVMCTRSMPILTWAIRRKIRSVALFSDWYEPLGWSEKRQHARLIRQLNHPCISLVGGNGVLTCKILAANGVDAAKLIPWEWSQPQLLRQYSPKTIRADKFSVKLVCVGSLDADAGIDDLLQGVLLLQQAGYTVDLQLIRNPLNDTFPVAVQETAWLKAQVNSLALSSSVTVHVSLLPEQMLELVRDADIAVFPHPGPLLLPAQDSELPLGVALAMAARTPIVACDHEVLAAHLYHGANAVTFPMRSPQSMVHRIERVMGQAALYAQLSEAAQITLDKIKVPACWGELIELWMTDSAYEQQRLHDFALSSGRYVKDVM